MKNRADLVAAIDLGSESVRTVLIRVPEDAERQGPPQEIEVLAMGQASSQNSIQYGEVVREAGAAEAVRHAVEEMEQTAGVEVNSAWVTAGSRSRRSINSSGSVSIPDDKPITAPDVRRAVRSAIPRDGGWLRPPYELLHALPQEFWVDDLDATDDPVGWSGDAIQSFVHLIACPRSVLESVEKAVNGAGVAVAGSARGGPVASPLASGYGVLRRDERGGDVLLLDIGAMTTDIAVFRRGVLWHSDVMPSGGRAYTNDLVRGLRISQGVAERTKRRYGTALVESVTADELIEFETAGGPASSFLPRRIVAEILQQRALSDFLKIRDELQRALSSGLPRQVVLTGGGARLEGLSEIARVVFGREAESRGPADVTGQRDIASQLQFASAVGLARYGARQLHLAASQRRPLRIRPMLSTVRGRFRRFAVRLRKAQ